MSNIHNLETQRIPALSNHFNRTTREQQIEEDVLKSRLTLGYILYTLLVATILLSLIFACLTYIIVRIFIW